MAEARKAKQLSFVLPNKVGQLAAVCEPIARANVSIEALSARESGENAEFVLVTESNTKAKKALASLGVEIRETEVIGLELPNKAGKLAEAARKLAEAGVNIRSVWGSAFSGKSAVCVLMTSDDRLAIRILGKKEKPAKPR